MFTFKHFVLGSLLVFVLAAAALAQENRAPTETSPEPVGPVTAGPLVTATATAERVRFVSPGTVVQLRLEVYNETGQKLFDTELHGGNVMDWLWQDGAGARLPAGSYACVLTTKSLSGRLSQRVGLVTVADKKAAVEAAGTAPLSQLSLAQQQVIGPVEGNAAFTVLQQSEAEAITTVTHDGADGQMTRSRGALSFRVGDFFAGKDSEQMRLTEDGNLGLGTDNPQAKLEVAGDVHASGTIRASKGIEFTDGTVQTTGLSGRKDSEGNLMPNVAGTGTQNRLAKWTDNAGTLGNSVVTEATGKLGIGTPSPNYEITLFGNDVGLQLISAATGVTANDGFRFGLSSTNHAFLWNTEATDMYFGTTATEQMRITAAGNVGIGTTAPNTKLDVVGKINTSTEYHIGGARMLSAPGTNNLFAGAGAGVVNTGTDNSFFGRSSGLMNNSGSLNTFSGAFAGASNTSGGNNSFYGYNAGAANVNAGGNSFFGTNAGQANTYGVSNSFFGFGAGNSNTGFAGGQGGPASNNSFFGKDAGFSNTSGSSNSFFGKDAGFSNTFGTSNAFFGVGAGQSNTGAGTNSFFGAFAGFANTTLGGNSFFGASAGYSNTACCNSFFGQSAGRNNTTGVFNTFFGSSAGEDNTTGGGNAFFGSEAGFANDSGMRNAFFGRSAGRAATGDDNSFFGYSAGWSNTTGSNNTIIGNSADVGSGALTFATAIGAGAVVVNSSTVVLGRSGDIVRVPGNFASVGTITTNGNLLVLGTSNFIGAVELTILGAAGSTDLCRNASNQLSTCSSSLRYKTNIAPFRFGLSLINQLRPIAYNWKDGGVKDVGFGAEDVARINPLFVTYNAAGEVEGVKYDRLSAVFVNAFKEQQAQITKQETQIERQQRQIDELKQIVCLSHPQAGVCKEK